MCPTTRRISQGVEWAESAGPRPAPPLPLLANHLAGSLITLLRWWLDNNLPYPPERMAELFQQLALPGAWAALDHDP